MNEVSRLRTETSKTYELDPKLGQGQYALEARTGPIHYKETYADHEPWLDLDETYSEPDEIKGIGKVLIYPRLPNIVTVFQDLCGYQIQSRSNPDHVARVELVAIDGQPVTSWLDTASLKTYARVHPFRVGIWKDLSGASRSKSVTMRWKVTELGKSNKDSHPFFFRNKPEAFGTADLIGVDRNTVKVVIETDKTRIDDNSWYWDELIPPEAKLVDTDWQVNASANDGHWNGGGYFSLNNYLYFGYGWGVYLYPAARWTSITIENGSIIVSASVSLRCAYTKSSTVSGTMYFMAEDNAPEFSSSSSEFLARPLTTASNGWTQTSAANGSWYSTPSCVSMLREVVNRAGWSSGNAVAWQTRVPSASNNYQFYDYDHDSASAPKLSVTWSSACRGPSCIPNVAWLSKSLLKRREI